MFEEAWWFEGEADTDQRRKFDPCDERCQFVAEVKAQNVLSPYWIWHLDGIRHTLDLLLGGPRRPRTQFGFLRILLAREMEAALRRSSHVEGKPTNKHATKADPSGAGALDDSC